MDYQVCWNDLDEAHYQEDWLRVIHHAETLLNWLKSGGTPPQVPELSEIPAAAANKIVKALCVDLLIEAKSRLNLEYRDNITH